MQSARRLLVVRSLPEQGKREEVAVKVVRKDLFRQDPKAEQNLDREIKILKRLKNSEYVVHLYHVQVRLGTVETYKGEREEEREMGLTGKQVYEWAVRGVVRNS